MCVRRNDVGFEIGGRENVGSEDGGLKRETSSSVERGSGGSMGTYLLRTEAMVMKDESVDDDAQSTQLFRAGCRPGFHSY